jgi:hypothetical protein
MPGTIHAATNSAKLVMAQRMSSFIWQSRLEVIYLKGKRFLRLF